MQGHGVVVVGASAGGIEALLRVIGDLPRDFAAAICVVVHLPADARGALPQMLERAGPLPAAFALHDEPLLPGRIRIAPPGRHLLLHHGSTRLSEGPRENGHRPAVDVLFRSAAVDCPGRAVGVVLSGTRNDGAAGLADIKRCGGLAVVQDPDTAVHGDMPRNAMARTPVDRVAHAGQLAAVLQELVPEPASSDGAEPTPPITRAIALSAGDLTVSAHEQGPIGSASANACPDIEQQPVELAHALWSAFHVLEEKAAMARRLSEDAELHGRALSAHQFAARSRIVEQQAAEIRKLLGARRTAAEDAE